MGREKKTSMISLLSLRFYTKKPELARKKGEGREKKKKKSEKPVPDVIVLL